MHKGGKVATPGIHPYEDCSKRTDIGRNSGSEDEGRKKQGCSNSQIQISKRGPVRLIVNVTDTEGGARTDVRTAAWHEPHTFHEAAFLMTENGSCWQCIYKQHPVTN